MKDSMFEVWTEGYQATGERSPASFHGVFRAPTFADAVKRCVKEKKFDTRCFDPERLSYWGCRFFDNEADARRSFG